MSYYEETVECPKCGFYSKNVEVCDSCGALIMRIRERQAGGGLSTDDLAGQSANTFTPADQAYHEPAGSSRLLSLLVGVIVVGVIMGGAYLYVQYQETQATIVASESITDAATSPNAPKDREGAVALTDAAADNEENAPTRETAAQEERRVAKPEPVNDEPGFFGALVDTLKEQAALAETEDRAVPVASAADSATDNTTGDAPAASRTAPAATATPEPSVETVATPAEPVAVYPSTPDHLAPITIGEDDLRSGGEPTRALPSRPERGSAEEADAAKVAGTTAEENPLDKLNIVPIPDLREAQFHSEVVSYRQKPVLVDFYASWCGPCKNLAPKLDTYAAIRKEDVKVVKVDADKFQEIKKDFKITSYPTLVLFVDGKEARRIVGAPQSLSILDGHLKSFYKNP